MKLDDIISVIRETAPGANVVKDKPEEVIISLATATCEGFENMFQRLELEGAHLGIDTIGVTLSTLEDAYVK